MESVKSRADYAVAQAKAAASSIDAAWLSLPTPPAISANLSAGEMLVKLAAAGDITPRAALSSAKRLRRVQEVKLADIGRGLDRARETLDAWRAAADCLAGDGTYLPAGFKHATEVRVLVQAAMAGSIEPREAVAAAAEIKRFIADASEYLADKQAVFERVKSAAGCAVPASAARYFDRLSQDPAYGFSDRKMLARAAKGFNIHATRRRVTHAAKFFSEAQRARSFGQIEQRATGVRGL